MDYFQSNQQGGTNPNFGPGNPPPNWNNPWFWMMYGGNNNQNNQNQGNNPWFNNQNNGQQMSMNQNNQQNNSNNQNSQISRPSVPCGIVMNEDEIKPGEVPMNGGVGMFAKSDLSRIFVKQWGSDGNIHTRRYVEEVVDNENIPANQNQLSLQDIWNNVNERFERIEAMISGLANLAQVNAAKKPNNNQKNNQKTGGNEA